MTRVIETLLDKADVINMIRGTSPSYESMNALEHLQLGSYTGGFNDKWDWNSKFPESLTIEELYFLYTKLKDSK